VGLAGLQGSLSLAGKSNAEFCGFGDLAKSWRLGEELATWRRVGEELATWRRVGEELATWRRVGDLATSCRV
jgi:hypothetical protein